MFVAATAAVIAGAAIPQLTATVERARAVGAARYLAGRLALARAQAVARSANVALYFNAAGDSFTLATYIDGNGNGVRARDIDAGIDPMIAAPITLRDQFPRISLALNDPTSSARETSALMSFTPLGTASSRTLYVTGQDGSQYAVRVLGATGRTRVLRYVAASRTWMDVL